MCLPHAPVSPYPHSWLHIPCIHAQTQGCTKLCWPLPNFSVVGPRISRTRHSMKGLRLFRLENGVRRRLWFLLLQPNVTTGRLMVPNGRALLLLSQVNVLDHLGADGQNCQWHQQQHSETAYVIMQNMAKDFICKNPKFLAFKQMFPITSFVITAYSAQTVEPGFSWHWARNAVVTLLK